MTETPHIEQRVCHQLHSVVPTLVVLKSQQQPFASTCGTRAIARVLVDVRHQAHTRQIAKQPMGFVLPSTLLTGRTFDRLLSLILEARRNDLGTGQF